MSGALSALRTSPSTSQRSGAATRRKVTSCAASGRDESSSGASTSRRLFCALSFTGAPLALTTPASAAVTASLLFKPPPTPSSATPVDGAFANLVTGVADAEMVATNVMTEEQFQLEFNSLFRREYPYYQKANRDKLPVIPDLSDMSGGLSNRTYFNFTMYVQWKVIAQHLYTDEAKAAFVRGVGRRIVQEIAPEASAAAKRARASGKLPSVESGEDLPAYLLTPLLEAFTTRGYILGYETRRAGADGIGDAPSYMARGSEIVGAQGADGAKPPAKFSLILRNPADLQGGVALRAEEEGFWQRIAPAAIESIFEDAGLDVSVDETFFQDQWVSPTGTREKVLLFLGDPLFQVDVPFTPDTLVLEVAARPKST